MNVTVWLEERCKRFGNEADIAATVEQQLARFASEVDRTVVAIRDINGNRGGDDQMCRITAHLSSGDVITVSERHSELAGAVTGAAERLQFAVSKSLERRSLHRQRASFAGTGNDSPADFDGAEEE